MDDPEDNEFGITKNSVEGIATPLRRSQPREVLGTMREDMISVNSKTGETTTTRGPTKPMMGRVFKRDEF